MVGMSSGDGGGGGKCFDLRIVDRLRFGMTVDSLRV